MIVARHPGAVKRATSYAERLKLGIAVIHGEVKLPESEQVRVKRSKSDILLLFIQNVKFRLLLIQGAIGTVIFGSSHPYFL